MKINSKFVTGIILNIIYIIIEVFYGFRGHSLALVADAGHNLSDVLALFLSWLAFNLGNFAATKKRTYGYKGLSNLTAFGNAIFILIAIGGIVVEAINRFFSPEKFIDSMDIIIVSIVGIFINGITTFLFINKKDNDLNIKSVFIHMLSDTFVSIGVAISGLIMLFTHLYWIDPLISIVISIAIFFETWNLLIKSFNLSINSVPDDINIDDIKHYLLKIPTVIGVHDLHVWGMSTTENALTVHLIRNTLEDNNYFIKKINNDLTKNFDICHITIQVELGKIKNESTDNSI